MKRHKLYNSLVVGGGLLLAGCASSHQSSASPVASPDDAPPEEKPAEPVASSAEPAKVSAVKPENSDDKCSECDGEGRGMLCPDPEMNGMNCCWLMGAKKHPCCPGL